MGRCSRRAVSSIPKSHRLGYVSWACSMESPKAQLSVIISRISSFTYFHMGAKVCRTPAFKAKGREVGLSIKEGRPATL